MICLIILHLLFCRFWWQDKREGVCMYWIQCSSNAKWISLSLTQKYWCIWEKKTRQITVKITVCGYRGIDLMDLKQYKRASTFLKWEMCCVSFWGEHDCLYHQTTCKDTFVSWDGSYGWIHKPCEQVLLNRICEERISSSLLE